MNPNGTQTHFPYIGNNQNYIRGKLNIDQDDLLVGGSINSSGNIIASGTALTNLNYNAITIPPSLVSLIILLHLDRL
jgi:hypothetical protein